MNMPYRRRMSPVINVQGNPISAAKGAASPQNTSIAMVRIITGSSLVPRSAAVPAAVPRASSPAALAARTRPVGTVLFSVLRNLRLALQPRGAARPLFRCDLFYVLEFVRNLFAASHFPLQLTSPAAPAAHPHRNRIPGLTRDIS